MFKFNEEDYKYVFERVNEGRGRLIPDGLYSLQQIKNMDAFFPEEPVTSKEVALLLLEYSCLIRDNLLNYLRRNQILFSYDSINYYSSICFAACSALYALYRNNEEVVTDEGYSCISDFEPTYNSFIEYEVDGYTEELTKNTLTLKLK